METIQLSQGINIHLIPTEKFKTTTISVLIRRPLNREEVTINALIPNILQRGSAKYDTMSKISSKIENMYGSIFETQIIKKGEQQIIQFYMEFVKEKNKDSLFESLEFIKEIMLNPLVIDNGFEKEYVESEKNNLKIGIEGRINNKAEYAKLRCIEEMCKDEPFGIYGDGFAEDIDKITPQSSYEHYINILKTSPIDFIVIGNEDAKKFYNDVRQLFQFERSESIEINLPELNYNPKENADKISEEIQITQGKICIGLRTGVEPTSEDFYKLLLMNEVLGGGANSKLFSVIREQESLCYYVNSFIFRFKSIILIQSGVETENFEKVICLVGEQIEKIKKSEIEDDELENARKSLIKKFEGIKDYPSATMDFYISQFMFKDNDNIEDVINKIKSVSKEDIPKMAEKLYWDTIYLLY